MDEHVLERGEPRLDREPMCGGVSSELVRHLRLIEADDVQRRSERRDLAHRVESEERIHELRARIRPHHECVEARLADDLVDRAGRQHTPVGDVADAVAALGFVHVMGRDQHGEAARREPVDLVPELAPGLRVDASGRLVEKEEPRLVHDAGGEREALLPAARQLPSELMAARGEAEIGEGLRDRLPARLEIVEAGDEEEILLDRQVLVEREPLRHVADLLLDAAALADDVIAEHGSLARVRSEKPADHADGRRLARAVGPEEADDLAGRDLERDVIDGDRLAEAFGQVRNVDDVRGRAAQGFTAQDLGSGRSTSTICPGCRRSGLSLAARASIR